MRNRETIEREMYRTREDLEENLAALKHTIHEKVAIGARARVAVERGKAKAKDLASKSKVGAIDLFVQAKTGVRERPVLVGAITASIIVIGALALIGRRRDWW